MDPDANPYASPTALDAPPEAPPRDRGVGASLQGVWLALAATTGLAFYDIETIVVAGPALAAWGLLTAWGLTTVTPAYALYLTLATPALTGLVALLIALWDWSPAEAQRVVPWVLAAWTVTSVPVSVSVGMRPVARDAAGGGAPRWGLRVASLGVVGVALVWAGATWLRGPREEAAFGLFGVIVLGWCVWVVRAAATDRTRPDG